MPSAIHLVNSPDGFVEYRDLETFGATLVRSSLERG